MIDKENAAGVSALDIDRRVKFPNKWRSAENCDNGKGTYCVGTSRWRKQA